MRNINIVKSEYEIGLKPGISIICITTALRQRELKPTIKRTLVQIKFRGA